jgi:hypothetical protein
LQHGQARQGQETIRTMKDYKTNVVSFQLLRIFPENPTEPDLQISIKPPVAEKLEAIAKEEGTDPACQAMLAILRFVNERRNWRENRPTHKRGAHFLVGVKR